MTVNIKSDVIEHREEKMINKMKKVNIKIEC